MTHLLTLYLVISGNVTFGWHGGKHSRGGWRWHGHWDKKEAMNSRRTVGKGGKSVPIKLTNGRPLRFGFYVRATFLISTTTTRFPRGNHWGRKQPRFPERQEGEVGETLRFEVILLMGHTCVPKRETTQGDFSPPHLLTRIGTPSLSSMALVHVPHL